jgi:hypothetical protein
MQRACWLFFLTGAYPVWRAWQANRRTSLFHAVQWAVAAWVAWGAMILLAVAAEDAGDTWTAGYLALCLTGCGNVAVLGARRPGVGAWNFVLVGLLAVMLLPVVEGLLAQAASLDTLRVVFLAGTLVIGVLNYLPTRLAAAAILLGLGSVGELLHLMGQIEWNPVFSWWLVGLVPWVAFVSWRWRAVPRSEFDALWLDFRDRFGLLWGQRIREQFNRSASHAGWPVMLRWQGLRLLPRSTLPEPDVQGAMVATLRAMLKRFEKESTENEEK